MIVAHQPVPLAACGRPSSQFRSDSRPTGIQTFPLSRRSRLLGLRTLLYPPWRDSCCKNTETTILTTFRINTCKSVSKQMTLTSFRINTYEKHRGGEGVDLFSFHRRHMRHVTPLSPVPSLDCAYFPSPRGCATNTLFLPLRLRGNRIYAPFVFIFLRIAFPATPFFSQPSALPRGVGVQQLKCTPSGPFWDAAASGVVSPA